MQSPVVPQKSCLSVGCEGWLHESAPFSCIWCIISCLLSVSLSETAEYKTPLFFHAERMELLNFDLALVPCPSGVKKKHLSSIMHGDEISQMWLWVYECPPYAVRNSLKMCFSFFPKLYLCDFWRYFTVLRNFLKRFLTSPDLVFPWGGDRKCYSRSVFCPIAT